MTRHCACGRPLNAGRSAGTKGHTRCLICDTARVMLTFRDPMTRKHRARVRRKKVTA